MQKFKKIILFDIDYTLFDTHEYKQSQLTNLTLYQEIEKLLESLKGEYLLGILSEGEEEFQRNKLIKTKIDHHFHPEHTHIVVDKLASLEDILSRYRDNSVIIVDDKLTILYNSKKILPSLYCVWIKRGQYADNQQPIPHFSPDAEVLTLENLKTVLISAP